MMAAIYGLSGPQLTDDERSFFRDARPAGYILFARNIVSREQLRSLTDALRELEGHDEVPILIDQEGGRVARMRPPEWPAFPSGEAFDRLYQRAPASAIEAARVNARALGLIDTLHPVYEGRGFRWRADGTETERVIEYRPTNQGENAASWQKSAFFQLWTSGEDELRRRIGHGDPADFLYLDAMRDEGEKDFLALAHRFARAGVIGEMDCFFSHWTTQCATGFSDVDVAALRRLVPSLGLAIKCASLARIAGTLVEVYLGRDAGRRVLSGRIARGVADRIRAVLWFSDLQGYTTITDTAEADEIIPLLNDYADAVMPAHSSRPELAAAAA